MTYVTGTKNLIIFKIPIISQTIQRVTVLVGFFLIPRKAM